MVHGGVIQPLVQELAEHLVLALTAEIIFSDAVMVVGVDMVRLLAGKHLAAQGDFPAVAAVAEEAIPRAVQQVVTAARVVLES